MTLTQALERADLTKAQLARLVGLKSGEAIRHYETGRRSPPGWRVRQIEEALGVPPGSIDWPRPEGESA